MSWLLIIFKSRLGNLAALWMFLWRLFRDWLCWNSDYVSPEVIKGSTGTCCESEDDKGAVEMTLNLKKPLPVFLQLEHAFAIDLHSGVFFTVCSKVACFTISRSIGWIDTSSDHPVRVRKKGWKDLSRILWKDKKSGGWRRQTWLWVRRAAKARQCSRMETSVCSTLWIIYWLQTHQNDWGWAKLNQNIITRTYTSIRSNNFYLGFDWCQIDKEEEFDEHHRNMFQTLLSSPSIRTDVKQEEMQDGACLPFDFFA